jgi:hypothetical protein
VEDPFQNTLVGLGRTKIWSCVPTGPEIKNDCTAEGQQKIKARFSLTAKIAAGSRQHSDSWFWVHGTHCLFYCLTTSDHNFDTYLTLFSQFFFAIFVGYSFPWKPNAKLVLIWNKVTEISGSGSVIVIIILCIFCEAVSPEHFKLTGAAMAQSPSRAVMGNSGSMGDLCAETAARGANCYNILLNFHREFHWQLNKTYTYFLSFSLSMVLQPFGPWPLFQILNPMHSR